MPTTPTVRAKAARNDGLADIPIIAPPPFELIPRAPLSAEEAAEARIACLLEKELELMSADGLHMKEPPKKRSPKVKRAEDEEEQFWMDDMGDCPDENDVETWLAEEEARECRYRVRACGKSPVTPSAKPASRARAAPASVELGIGENLLEECMDWIIEVRILSVASMYALTVGNRSCHRTRPRPPVSPATSTTSSLNLRRYASTLVISSSDIFPSLATLPAQLAATKMRKPSSQSHGISLSHALQSASR